MIGSSGALKMGRDGVRVILFFIHSLFYNLTTIFHSPFYMSPIIPSSPDTLHRWFFQNAALCVHERHWGYTIFHP